MAKIIQKHEDCIGCGTCVVLCPDFWEMEDNGKAKPKMGKKNLQDGNYEFDIENEKIGCNKDAIDNCPVSIIKIRTDFNN